MLITFMANDNHSEKLEALPQGFIFLGQGPLKKPFMDKLDAKKPDDLLIWDNVKKEWHPIPSQGSAKSYYAAKEGSQAHRENI